MEKYKRNEIWILARFLQKKFGKEAWVVSDRHGWYDLALEIHNTVYAINSPYRAKQIQPETVSEYF